tara:strand:- start:544 stop:1029 length:486 start_codon:yes stop_codon:yes gene_type:complete
MKKLLLLLLLVFGYGFSQTNCEECVAQGGFYCGDDPSNWTVYSPNGCVPNGFNNLFYLNDGWLDCVDGSDEDEAVPTTLEDCSVYDYVPCDTVYVEVPIIDTLYVTEYIDCATGLPCENTGILELLQKTKNENKIYNLNGKEIYRRENVYIENGKINFKLK